MPIAVVSPDIDFEEIPTTISDELQQFLDESGSVDGDNLVSQLADAALDSGGLPFTEMQNLQIEGSNNSSAIVTHTFVTGRLGTLTEAQRATLYHLWAMILDFWSCPYKNIVEGAKGKIRSTKSQQKAILSLAKQLKKDAMSGEQVKHRLELIDSQMDAMTKHPLWEEFWIQMGAEDPDRMLLRFLRARKWNVLDAFYMLIECLRWRKQFEVQKILEGGEMALEPTELIRSGLWSYWHVDRQDRLFMLIDLALYNTNGQTPLQGLRQAVYQAEWGRRMMKDGTETIGQIANAAGQPPTLKDVKLALHVARTLQNYYPETLEQAIFINLPRVVGKLWRTIRPLLDPSVANKIVFAKKQELSQYVDPSRLSPLFGGTDAFAHQFVEPTPADLILPRLTPETLHTMRSEIALEIRKLVEQTLCIHQALLPKPTFLSNSKKAFGIVEGPVIAPGINKLESGRKRIKDRLQAQTREWDYATLPLTNYHRIGAIDGKSGKVSWDSAFGRKSCVNNNSGSTDSTVMSRSASIQATESFITLDNIMPANQKESV